jgi:hypothetical protein
MAIYFVAGSGSNTSPYDTWAKAATSLQTALTAASTAGDTVVIKYNGVPSGDTELSADTTYSFAADNVSLVSASADDSGTAYTLTEMGTANWVGNSTTNRYVRFGGGKTAYVWGVTVRVSGAQTDHIILAYGSASNIVHENCYFWQENTSTGLIYLSSSNQSYGEAINCTFRFGHAYNSITTTGPGRIIGGSVSSAGTIPDNIFSAISTRIAVIGMDLSSVTTTLVNPVGNCQGTISFDRCSFGSGVVVMPTSTNRLGTTDCFVSDCAYGDTHLQWGYYSGLGSVVRDTSIYYTGSEAGNESWKVTTSADVCFTSPFATPWIDIYHTGTSAITPRFEIVRSGSTTKWKTNEVWGEFEAKTTGATSKATRYSDRQTISDFSKDTAASDQADGAGTGAWTGENASSWSGKVDSGAAITPAETGYISGRVRFAVASATLYIDPVIRTS